MGYFVKVNTTTYRNYKILSKDAYAQFPAMFEHLKFYAISLKGCDSVIETYYDTPTNLLKKSGIILSRIQEGSKTYFRVENNAYLNTGVKNMQVFVHPVGVKDTITDHAFYLKEGIESLFLTAFSIDLENVLKQAVPKTIIKAKSDIYSVINGKGLRVLVAIEQRTYKNFETKRNAVAERLTTKLISPEKAFLDDFEVFNSTLQKYCKAVIPIKDKEFEIFERATHKIAPPPPKDDKNKKQKKA